MLCYRAVDTTADEDGRGGDEENEINSMGKPMSIEGLLGWIAMILQQKKQKREPN